MAVREEGYRNSRAILGFVWNTWTKLYNFVTLANNSVQSACSFRLAWSLIGIFVLHIFMLPSCYHMFCNYLMSGAFGYSVLHTPWCRVLLEKLIGLQLVKRFPAFHLTRRFITAFASARHLSLSWASCIQSIPPHPTSWRTVLLLFSHVSLGLPSGLFPHVFSPKPYI